MSIFDKKPDEISDMVLQIAAKHMDITNMDKLVKSLRKHYQTSGRSPVNYYDMPDIAKIWIQSLEKGTPDFSVYSSPQFVPEAIACYESYSKHYITNLTRKKKDFPITVDVFGGAENKYKILDMGCGVGLTTAAIATVFSNSQVVGTQVEGFQRKIGIELSKEYGFKIRSELGDNKPDIVFALDYLEHFEDPFAHIMTVLRHQPKYLVLANSFAHMSVGHFYKYYNDNYWIKSKQMGRVFNRWLHAVGYEKVKTGYYNDRPAVWILPDKRQIVQRPT